MNFITEHRFSALDLLFLAIYLAIASHIPWYAEIAVLIAMGCLAAHLDHRYHRGTMTIFDAGITVYEPTGEIIAGRAPEKWKPPGDTVMKTKTLLFLVQGNPKGNYRPWVHEIYPDAPLAEKRAAFLRELHPDANFGVYKCEAFI